MLFSLLVLSDSLQLHELQHARLPCPSVSPRACSDSLSIESVMLSNYLILCRLLLFLPSVFPSIRVFSNESALCNSMNCICSIPGFPPLLSPEVCSNSYLSIELVMPSNHHILCCPLLFLPSVFPSIRVFSNESVLLLRWPKYWSFSFSLSSSSEYSGLISFRIDWFNLLAVQGTLKSSPT